MIDKKQIEFKLALLKKELESEERSINESLKDGWYGSSVYSSYIAGIIKSQINILNWVLQNEEGVLNDR